MPEYDELNDDDDGTPDIVRQRNKIKDLESQLKEQTESAQRAETAERKLMFIEAGIELSERNRYFMDAYKGDMNVEAIKAEASKAGFLAEVPETDAGERAGIDAISDAAAGAIVNSSDQNARINQQIAEWPQGDVAGLMGFLQQNNVPTSYDRP